MTRLQPLGLGRGRAGAGETAAAQQASRRQLEHRHQLLEAQPAQQPGERPSEAGGPQRQAEAIGIGQGGGEQGAGERAP